MERLIDPVLSDLQFEYENALSTGSKWQGRWIWTLGHVALLKVVIRLGWEKAMEIPRRLIGDDARAIRILGFSVAFMVVGTVLLAAVPSIQLLSRGRPELTIYLIPQALPISVPVGLTLGILYCLGRAAASRRSRRLVLLLALTSSVASFAMLAWVIPATNHAFRVSVAGHFVKKGATELTISELRHTLERGTHDGVTLLPPQGLARLSLNYHRRWALACAPFVLSLFALALTSQGQRGRLMLGLAGCATILGYYVVVYAAGRLTLDNTISAFAAAWTPNAAFVLVSIALVKSDP